MGIRLRVDPPRGRADRRAASVYGVPLRQRRLRRLAGRKGRLGAACVACRVPLGGGALPLRLERRHPQRGLGAVAVHIAGGYPRHVHRLQHARAEAVRGGRAGGGDRARVGAARFCVGAPLSLVRLRLPDVAGRVAADDGASSVRGLLGDGRGGPRRRVHASAGAQPAAAGQGRDGLAQLLRRHTWRLRGWPSRTRPPHRRLAPRAKPEHVRLLGAPLRHAGLRTRRARPARDSRRAS
mmetsp:Transcript_2920/g.9222  ORF Transcript_2920/g.9222 Transcript_2920/m.9222 type:complete len:238 (-) Transcript_2920:827-1540(-)